VHLPSLDKIARHSTPEVRLSSSFRPDIQANNSGILSWDVHAQFADTYFSARRESCSLARSNIKILVLRIQHLNVAESALARLSLDFHDDFFWYTLNENLISRLLSYILYGKGRITFFITDFCLPPYSLSDASMKFRCVGFYLVSIARWTTLRGSPS
jgi:hypothetical protein